MCSDGGDGSSYWSKYLLEDDEAHEAGKKTVLVLGEPNSGKSTLLKKLLSKNNSVQQFSPSLEFVSDSSFDFWIFNMTAFHTSLLKFPLNESTISSSSVIILVSISDPSQIPNQISDNLNLLQEHLGRVAQPHQFPLYVVLSHIPSLTEHQLLSVQSYVRRVSLQYSAGILFWDGNDVDLIRDSLLSTLESTLKPRLTDNRAIFIPRGWDSNEKIAFLEDRIPDFDPQNPFRDWIVASKDLKSIPELVSPLEEQDFYSQKQKCLPTSEQLGLNSLFSSSRKEPTDYVVNESDLSAFFHNLISNSGEGRRKK